VLGQYYVGATDDNHVAIFEGVRGGPVLGIPLHRVAESSCLDPKQAPNCDSLTLDELQESAREDVRKGVIPEKPGVDGARDAVRRLWLGALLPTCTANTATTGTTTTTAATGTTTSTSGTSASGTTSSATSSTPTLTSAQQQPGKNCRKVG
jgi:protein phosphatase